MIIAVVLGLVLSLASQQARLQYPSHEPATLPSPGSVAWLRADSHVERDVASLAVVWEDAAPIPHALDQPDGAFAPRWDRHALNGRPGLRFDGDDVLDGLNGFPTGDYTKVILIRPDAGTTGHVYSSRIGHGLSIGPGDLVEMTHNGTVFAAGNAGFSLDRPVVLMATYDMSTNEGRVFVDTDLIAEGISVGDNFDPSIQIGGERSVGSFSGVVTEVLAYDRVLDEDERQQTYRYLRRRWMVPRAPVVTFSIIPRDGQLIPRDLQTGFGDVRVQGQIETAGFDSIAIELLRDGVQVASTMKALTYGPGGAGFSMLLPIEAGLYDQTLRVKFQAGRKTTTVAERVNLTCGDVFIIQGQSNAAASDIHGEGLSELFESRWIRSFGSAISTDEAVDLHWSEADAVLPTVHGSIGAWGARAASMIVSDFGVPVAILNGAVGDSPILDHLRDDVEPTNTSTIYGRLLQRARDAGVADGVRAILWYQGETDSANPSIYPGRFDLLSNAWREDFSSLEWVYVFQLREGCGFPFAGIREFQRTLPGVYPDVRLMSTTAAPGHDGCHFFQLGYQELGDRLFRVMNRDLYGGTDTQNIDPPDILGAVLLDDQITLTFSDPDDSLLFDPGAEVDFVLDDPTVFVTGGTVSGNTIVLDLSGATSATMISYIGHPGDGPWVSNARGVGALTFFELPLN